MRKISSILFASLLLASCHHDDSKEDNSDGTLIAGVVPKVYSVHLEFQPDTIFNIDKSYDFNNDSTKDMRFHSISYEYDDPLGPHGNYCNSNVTIIDSLMSAAVYRGTYFSLIHYGDKIDYQLKWNQEMTSKTFLFNEIMSTRGVINKMYWDSTGYIGINYGNRLGWIKIKVERCNKIIIYESLVK